MISFFVIAYYSFDNLLDPGMANAPKELGLWWREIRVFLVERDLWGFWWLFCSAQEPEHQEGERRGRDKG